MTYDYFRVTGAHGTVLDYADLFSISFRNDDVQEFDTRWDEILLSVTKIPPDVLESLYKLRIRESDQLNTVLDLYDVENQKISRPDYQKLKTMVKRSTDQKLRLRNLDARHGRIEPGAVVKSRKGIIGIEGGKGGKKKASVRKETNAVSATIPKIVHKNKNTLPPRLPIQPYHEVEVCRGWEVSEAKVTIGPFFDNRADIIGEVAARERLVNTGIRPSANSIKMKRVVRLETSVCFRITRLMNNQIKSPRRATSQQEEKAMTRMLWLLWKVHHNWVVYHKIQMHSLLKGTERNSKSSIQ